MWYNKIKCHFPLFNGYLCKQSVGLYNKNKITQGLSPSNIQEGSMDATPSPHKIFQIFENRIYFKGLKLSVTVHSSVAEILICQFLALPWLPQISCRFGEKSTCFDIILYFSFLHQIAEIHEFVHCISILA